MLLSLLANHEVHRQVFEGRLCVLRHEIMRLPSGFPNARTNLFPLEQSLPYLAYW